MGPLYGFGRSGCRNIILKMGKDIPFQVDILLEDIPVAVRLGNELTALAVDEQGGFPVHSLDRAQAPTVVLIGPRCDSALGHRGQPLIIGQVVDRGVRAVYGDITRGVVAAGRRRCPGALREPVINQSSPTPLIHSSIIAN